MSQKQKILIVDDRKENLIALRRTLGDVEAVIIEASSGNEALIATLDHDFSVALLDVQMPEMNGYELARHLRGERKTQTVPIIFLTAAYSDEQHMFEGYEAGGVDYITKPFSPQVLLGKLKIFLKMDGNRRELELHRDHLERLVAERTSRLKERVKELKCLYAMATLMADRDKSLEETLQATVDIIPPAWQFADIAWARIGWRGRQFTSACFKETTWKQSADIAIAGEKVGTLEVGYLEERPLLDEGPFAHEERQLLNELAQRLGERCQQWRLEEERQRLEEQLRQSLKMEAVGRLAGGVAHDFNNMLNVIIGYAEVLAEASPAGQPGKEIEEIIQAARRSATLTRQLLAFSRKQPLQPEVLDLEALLKNLDRMLRRVIGEDIDLVLKPAEKPGCIYADPGQIEQVIVNLAVNARDAMPKGGKLTLELANVELDELYGQIHPGVQAGSYVRIAVSDSGCGMDKETMSKIFEPFFTTKPKGEGTGLGLATAYGIVRQSGGHIWAYSEPGQGTVFKVYLPRLRARPDSPEVRPIERRVAGGGELILVVEDESSLLQLFESILRKLGYRVAVAANGREALHQVQVEGLRPDLVLTDVVMPDVGGAELAETLRQSQPDIKVLFMSGYPDSVVVERLLIHPGTPFIQKPFTLQALSQKINTALQPTPEEAVAMI